MDIKWLEDFLSLAQTRNFSRAAEDRNVTQSALSRRIKALEAWVGADLVDRSSYPLVLTPAGKLFNTAATDAMRVLNDARAVLRVQETNDEVLRVSAGHALALDFFPNWLGAVQARHGALRARILPANVHDSVLSLIEGTADLLLCYHHADLPIELDPQRFEYVHLGVETVSPVCVPGRSGAPAFGLPGSKAAPLPWLAYTPTSYFGRVVQRIRERAGRTACLQNRYESDMAGLLRTMALSGHGLCWLPESCIARDLAEGRLVRAGGAQWTLQLDIRLFRAVGHRKPVLDAVWETLR
jgi:DNA-binding transcriptional LysR family regulator